ncbi:uncharacterized protein LOC122282336 [Carya illinoinensis]|uniref:uncharacterized protein LOC122282336 n=1 Tax=Carya illinoinensis TaxID=32201 RepID=UPI001C71A5B5|nr:uncharacterized protein LOC122282336 [Carya illinoinensis]
MEGEEAMQFGAWLRAESVFRRKMSFAARTDSAGEKVDYSPSSHRAEGSVGSTDHGERLVVPEEELAPAAEKKSNYECSEIGGIFSKNGDKAGIVMDRLEAGSELNKECVSGNEGAQEVEIQFSKAVEFDDSTYLSNKGDGGKLMGFNGPHLETLDGLQPNSGLRPIMHVQSQAHIPTCTAQVVPKAGDSIAGQNSMNAVEQVKDQTVQRGAQKWKRRARSQGRLAASLDSVSRTKRLRAEDGVLNEVVAANKGKGDNSKHKVLPGAWEPLDNSKSGGLLLMWKQDIQLELLNYSQRHINAFITNDMGDARWLLTCFYGHPEHFSKVFLSTSPTREKIDQCLCGVEQKVSEEMRLNLNKVFLKEEIEVALKQMSYFKAPGPYGFSAGFYQDHWDIVGDEVSTAVLSFLHSGIMPADLNHTLIALVPKVISPTSVHDFRPISLCNVLYKLISKVLPNRMKGVLSKVISWNQSAFIPGRLITDNVMVAYELLHSMQSRQHSKVGSMAIKLDMFKAYDRVEWDFLEAMLLKLGFGSRWTGLIMAYVKSVSYAVKLNGVPSDTIIPSRGIRQGDPLSPYLCLICAVGLSSLLKQAENRGVLRGVAASRGGIRINHLLFADDCVIFCQAKQEEWFMVEQLLSKYEGASGQSLNKQKTSICFSKNKNPAARELILQSTNGVVCGDYNKYLGLPTMIGRYKYMSFRGLKERIWRRMCSWKSVFLSTAGKEILIKSVLQAIPSYTMSVFKLPCGLIKEIEALFSKFWWSHNKSVKGIHWKSWEKLGQVKTKGGLGFRSLASFNKALLSKQLWRLIQDPSSLVARVFKHKYYNSCNVLDSKVETSPSHIWRSIWSAMDVVKARSVWRVGNGESIKIWQDRWLPRYSTYMIQSPISLLDMDARVAGLINSGTREWKADLIDAIFNLEESKLILSLPISIRGASDKLMWVVASNGIFLVKSAYFVAYELQSMHKGQSSNASGLEAQWKKIWGLQVPGKVKQVLWKALTDILPTMAALVKKQVLQDGLCPICTREEESVLHVLWTCPAATDVWGDSSSPVKKWPSDFVDFSNLWGNWSMKLEGQHLEQVAVVCHKLWARRNRWVFEQLFQDPASLFMAALNELEIFQAAGSIQQQQNSATAVQQDQLSAAGSIQQQQTSAATVWQQQFSAAGSIQQQPISTVAVQQQQLFVATGQQRVEVHTKWSPASEPFYKLNFDASYSEYSNCMGIGIVLRDGMGDIEVVLVAPKAHVLSAFHAECYALLRAMQLCRELGFSYMVFEGDAK